LARSASSDSASMPASSALILATRASIALTLRSLEEPKNRSNMLKGEVRIVGRRPRIGQKIRPF